MKFGDLVDTLQAIGLQASLVDLRDMIWLASRITVMPRQASTLQSAAPTADPTVFPETPPLEPPVQPEPVEPTPMPSVKDLPSAFFTDVPYGGGAAARRVQLRGAPALPDALAIGRALRPMSRRRTGGRVELDERATAEFIADTGLRSAVWRPAFERWFDIVIAVEEVPSLAAWRPMVAEFERLLHRQGGFRSVRTVGLRAAGGGRMAAFGSDAHEVPIGALQERNGRRIVLVLSDGTSSAWRHGRIGEWLAAVGERSPLAVVQLLPQSLWPNTAIGFAELRTRSPRLGAPAAQLSVLRPGWARGEPGVVVPVLALEPASVKAWTRMVLALGNAWGAAALVPLPDNEFGAEALADALAPLPSAEQRAASFRASTTPDAQRLAAYFSIVRPLTPPVMRVIHRAMSPASGAVALAQVFLGGLLHPVVSEAPAAVDEVVYEFHAGLRERLSESLTHTDFFQVNLALHDFLQQQTGTAFDFFALLEDSTGDARLPDAALPFAQSARAFAQKLGLVSERASLRTMPAAQPLAQLEITLNGGVLSFVHRSARGELTLRHQVKQVGLDWLKNLGEASFDSSLAELAKAVVPVGLQGSNAIANGPGLIELLLDERSRLFPWEALIRGLEPSGPPLAVTHALTRRLLGSSPRRVDGDSPAIRSLVIGEPTSNANMSATLPGSHLEARKVSNFLEQNLHTRNVQTVIGGSGVEAIHTFREVPLRVLHFAGHGIVVGRERGEDTGESVRLDFGSVTIGMADFRALARMPELVFLSCQYGGQMAPHLIGLGARVAIGCVGGVSDMSTAEFATAFFESLTQGASVIEAMREARRHCWQANPGDDVWGRFQCYGEPQWRLDDVGEHAGADAPVVVSNEPIPTATFVSYASVDNARREGARKGWVSGLVATVQTWNPALRLEMSEDLLISGRKWSARAAQRVAGSERLLVVMSQAFCSSDWCRKELEQFLAHRPGHRIVIVEIEPTDRTGWHSALRDLASLKFWDEQRHRRTPVLPIDLPPTGNAADDDLFMQRLTYLLRAFEAPVLRLAPEPAKAWVLVAGTGRKNKLSLKLTLTCDALGKLLARQNYGLVTGGWPGVDEAVARSFAGELELMDSSIAIEARLAHVMAEGDKPVFSKGLLIHVPKGDGEYKECIARARFVVLVGGAGGTREIANRAHEAGRAVLPLADSGGDAKRYYNYMSSQWETGAWNGLAAADLTTLAGKVPEVVNGLIEILDRLVFGDAA